MRTFYSIIVVIYSKGCILN